MDARPWQFTIKQALAATAIVAGAAWFVHYTADGTEPLSRLAGIFVVPVLFLAAAGSITRRPFARRYGGKLTITIGVVLLLWLMAYTRLLKWPW